MTTAGDGLGALYDTHLARERFGWEQMPARVADEAARFLAGGRPRQEAERVFAAPLRAKKQAVDGRLATGRFAEERPTSLLPDMLTLARDGGYRLCFVSVRTREMADGVLRPEIAAYQDDLRAWLAENGGCHLHLAEDARVTPDWHADGDHVPFSLLDQAIVVAVCVGAIVVFRSQASADFIYFAF